VHLHVRQRRLIQAGDLVLFSFPGRQSHSFGAPETIQIPHIDTESLQNVKQLLRFGRNCPIFTT
jgi:hypothetical protein